VPIYPEEVLAVYQQILSKMDINKMLAALAKSNHRQPTPLFLKMLALAVISRTCWQTLNSHKHLWELLGARQVLGLQHLTREMVLPAF
jgi:hypothetical protein